MSTNSSGTVVGEQGHFPYGESWYLNNSTTKWEFTTYERDAESANDYARARYNVNRLGRFSSPDPLPGSIADPQSLNRYSYVRSMPTMLTDPTGMSGSGPLGCLSAGNQRDDSPGDDADLPPGSGPYADADPPPQTSCPSFNESGGGIVIIDTTQGNYQFLGVPWGFGGSGLGPSLISVWTQVTTGETDSFNPTLGNLATSYEFAYLQLVGSTDTPEQLPILPRYNLTFLASPTPPTPPQDPCVVTQGLHTSQNAVDIRTPGGYGTLIPAPANGSIVAANVGGWPVPPPYDLTQPAPAGSTDYVQFATSTGYTVTYFHAQPAVPVYAPALFPSNFFTQGTPLAVTDNTGRQTAPHLHVTVQNPGGGYMDPRVYFPQCD